MYGLICVKSLSLLFVMCAVVWFFFLVCVWMALALFWRRRGFGVLVFRGGGIGDKSPGAPISYIFLMLRQIYQGNPRWEFVSQAVGAHVTSPAWYDYSALKLFFAQGVFINMAAVGGRGLMRDK
jgi:hypothetical protein